MNAPVKLRSRLKHIFKTANDTEQAKSDAEQAVEPDAKVETEKFAPYSLRLSAEERALLDEWCQGAPWSSY